MTDQYPKKFEEKRKKDEPDHPKRRISTGEKPPVPLDKRPENPPKRSWLNVLVDVIFFALALAAIIALVAWAVKELF